MTGTDLVVRFDAADLLRGDLQQATAVAVDAVGSNILTVDEARALMGYSPMAEADKPNTQETSNDLDN